MPLLFVRFPRLFAIALGLTPGLLGGQAPPGSCNTFCLSRLARAALAAGHNADFLMYARRVAARAPDHPGAIYAVASGFALVGEADSALAWLNRLAEIGASRAPVSDSSFAGLWTLPAFGTMQARLDANRRPVIHGKMAFQLPDPDLVPEALAWDPSSRSWFVGSLSKRKVIRVQPSGAVTDFLSAPDVLRVVGIHVDSARGLLWFATWAPRSSVEGSQDEPPSESRLFKCDLGTGRILHRYSPADSGTSHLFNDVALASNGDVFITDTEQGWLYRIGADADSLEVFLRPDPDEWSGANGITLTGDDRTLYIAFVEGIARMNLATRQLVRLGSPAGTSTAQLDGLYWDRGALLGIQNQRGLEQVVRYQLAADGRSIMSERVLERGDSLLRRPTTGALVGRQFYYIANSQFERLGYDNRLSPATDSTKVLTTVRVVDLQEH